MGGTIPTEITTFEISFLLTRYLNNNSDYINIHISSSHLQLTMQQITVVTLLLCIVPMVGN